MKKTNIFLVVIIGIVLSFTLIGCKNAVVENESVATGNDEKDVIEIVDLAGRNVIFDGPVEKSVIANGRFVREFSAIYGDDFLNHLVGVGNDFEKFDLDIYKKYEEKFPQIKDVARIGHFSEGGLDIEKIVSINPDVVFIQKWFLKAAGETIKRLEDAGIKVVIIDFSIEPMDGPYKSILLMGKILGRENKAEEIASAYKEEIDKVFKILSETTKEKPNVYVENGGRGPNEYGKTYGDCAWGKIVEFAGGVNIGKEVVKGMMGDIAPEFLIEKDPENIIIAGYSSGGAPDSLKFGYGITKDAAKSTLLKYTTRDGWDNLKAVKNKNVTGVTMGHCLQIDNFYSLQRIAKDLYPEEFESLDPEKNFRDFNDKYSVIDFSGTWSVGIK